MSWCSIREYTERRQISMSTARRQIAHGRVYARKFGRNWYVNVSDGTDTAGRIQMPVRTEELTEPVSVEAPGATSHTSLQSVVDFSSKALHHYLVMTEKLTAEKDVRISEKERELAERKQEVSELQRYVKLLEAEMQRLKERPEGWS